VTNNEQLNKKGSKKKKEQTELMTSSSGKESFPGTNSIKHKKPEEIFYGLILKHYGGGGGQYWPEGLAGIFFNTEEFIIKALHFRSHYSGVL
jgi:hypothetical protein